MTATYHVDSDWGAGFVTTITVKNNATTPINSWRVTWTWPGNQQVTNGWNATISQSGNVVTAGNMPYNGTIPPDGTTTSASRPPTAVPTRLRY